MNSVAGMDDLDLLRILGTNRWWVKEHNVDKHRSERYEAENV